MVIQSGKAIHGIHHRNHAVQHEILCDNGVAHDRLHDGGGIGKARGLDHHPFYRLQLTCLDTIHQFRQRIHQLATYRAAEATLRQFDDALARAFDQHVIDADIAEFIDDDRRIAHRGILEKPVEQRRFSGAEKSGDDGNRDAIARHDLPVC
ncbi:hypothetical protein D3C78_1097310 [compost metagenome]